LPKNDEVFNDLLVTSIFSTVFFSLSVFLVAYFSGSEILSSFSLDELIQYIYIIPLGILMLSINDIIRSWNVRVREFQRASKVKVISTLGSRICTVLLALKLKGDGKGLIIGDIIHNSVEAIGLFGKEISFKKILSIDLKRLKSSLVKYKDYPVYFLPINFIGSFGPYIPIYFLSVEFDTSIVGQFSMANRLLNIPAILIINSLTPLILKRMNDMQSTTENGSFEFINKLIDRFIIIVLPLFLLVLLLSKLIFYYFLGDQWGLAGNLSVLIGLYFPFFILESCLNPIHRIYRKERSLFLFNVISIGLIVTVLGFAIELDNIYMVILIFSFGNILLYSVHIFYLLNVVNYSNYKKLFIPLVLYVVLIFGLTIFSDLIY
jgi:O-antigen/teichoic acid export membrane protein